MTPEQIEREFKRLKRLLCCTTPKQYTTAERDALANPKTGVIIFNTTTNKLNFYNGTAWEQITSA